eukprot:jgi/Chrzof1/10629/Cz05g05230.t1
MDHLDSLIAEIKSKVWDWELNVFDIQERSGGHPLYVVGMAVLEELGLVDGWKIDRQTLAKYILAVEGQYKPNPYHNATHAADFTQAAAVVLKSVHQHMGQLSQLEDFCVIMASVVHDLSHPGVNNDFLVKSRDSTAIVYNDRSVNENMHVSKAFQLALENPELNIFSKFSDEEYMQARRWIVGMVLSTDMAVHYELLNKYKAALSQEPDERAWKERDLMYQMVVHIADLINTARPFNLALKWGELVTTEFLQQGGKEAQLGLPVSRPCDHQLVSLPGAQLFVIDTFVLPTLELLQTTAPSFVQMVQPRLQDAKKKWQQLAAAGVKHPQQTYPEVN